MFVKHTQQHNKCHSAFLYAVLLLVCAVLLTFGPASADVISVEPLGTDTLFSGRELQLQFTVDSNTSVEIYLYSDSGSDTSILAQNYPVQEGLNTFTVPSLLVPTQTFSCDWKITVLDSTVSSAKDSEQFCLAVVYPILQKEYAVEGEEIEIEWSGEAFDDEVFLQLWYEGSAIENITSGSVNATLGTVTWEVVTSGPYERGYTIRVIDAIDHSTFAASYPFEIDSEDKFIIEVIAPSQTLVADDSYTISWSKKGNVRDVTISLDFPEESKSYVIASDADGDAESYEWTSVTTFGNPTSMYNFTVKSNLYQGVEATSDSFPINNTATLISIDTPSEPYLVEGNPLNITFFADEYATSEVYIFLILGEETNITITDNGWPSAEGFYFWDQIDLDNNGRSDQYQLLIQSGDGALVARTKYFEIDVEEKSIEVLNLPTDLKIDQETTIEWTTQGFIDTVDIELLDANQRSLVGVIATQVSADQGSFNWTAETFGQDADRDFVVRISATKYPSAVRNVSLPFQISSNGRIDITLPNEPYFAVDSGVTVSFEYTGPVGTFELKLCEGQQCSLIGQVDSTSDTTYSWTVTMMIPNVEQSKEYYFKAESLDANIVGQSSQFEIDVLKSITVDKPASYWVVGDNVNIEFSTVGVVGPVSVKLVHGSESKEIITNENGSPLSWTVDLNDFTSGASLEYTLTVSSVEYPAVFGKSEEFEIDTEKKSLSIETPNESYWFVGGTFNVSWTYSGYIEDIFVDIRRTSNAEFSQTLFTEHVDLETLAVTIEPRMVPEWAEDYYLFIESVDYSTVNGISSEFTADTGKKEIIFENINANTIWTTSSDITIRWQSSGFTGENVNIYLEQGDERIDIAEQQQNSGSFDWQVDVANPSDTDRFTLTIETPEFPEATATSEPFRIVSECPSDSVGPIDGSCVVIEFSVSSPETVRGCDTATTVSVDTSTIGDNTNLLDWSWEVSAQARSMFSFSSTVQEEAQNRINEYFAGKENTENVDIEANGLFFGFCYTFRLTGAWTGDGQKGDATFESTSCVLPFVSVAISLPSPVQINPSERLDLRGSVSLRSCSDFEEGPLLSQMASPSSFFNYEFFRTDIGGDSDSETKSLGSASVAKLRLPANEFKPGITSEIMLRGTVAEDFDTIESDLVELTAVSQDLVVIISGGSRREVLYSSQVVLDASDSYDPDGTDETQTFTWDCISDDCDPLDLSGIEQGAVFTIPEDTFEAQREYRFELTYSKGSRSESSTVTIVTFDEPRATVSIDSRATTINVEQRLIITTTIENRQPETTLQWSCDNLNLEQEPNLRTNIDERNLVLSGNTLNAGETYTFRLTAVTGDKESYSEIAINVNEPPQGGSIQRSPSQGEMYSAQFELSANGFTDPHAPLQYEFGYFDNNRRFVSLSSGFGFQSTLTTRIPIAGDITLVVRCRDSHGAIASRETSVTVTEPVDADAVREAATQDFESSIVKGDIQSAVVSFAAIVRGLTLSNNNNKRSLQLAYNDEQARRTSAISQIANLVSYASDDPSFAQQLTQYLYDLTAATSEMSVESHEQSISVMDELVMPQIQDYSNTYGVLSNLFKVELPNDDPQNRRLKSAQILSLNRRTTQYSSESLQLVSGEQFQVFDTEFLNSMTGVVGSDLLSEGVVIDESRVTRLELSAGLQQVLGDRDAINVFVANYPRNSYSEDSPLNPNITVSAEALLQIELRDLTSYNDVTSGSLPEPIRFTLPKPGDLNMEPKEEETKTITHEYRCSVYNSDSRWDAKPCSAQEDGDNIVCSCTTTGGFAVSSERITSVIPPPTPTPTDSDGGGGGGGGAPVAAIVVPIVVVLLLVVIITVVVLGVLVYYKKYRRGGLHDNGNLVPTYTDIDF